MTSPLLAAAMLFLGSAELQTVPIGMPVFPEPPELNGADPVERPNAILHNSGLKCLQSAIGTHWECLVKSSEMDAVEASVLSAAGAASSAASAAQSTANSAATTAASASTTANAAQSASSANATAIAALQATVTGLSKRACANASISGVSIPLLGISSTTTVAIAGAPVGTSCDVGLPSFLPLGAKPVAAVLTAGTASLRFEGNSGLLSAIIAIPSGTYRVCCDL